MGEREAKKEKSSLKKVLRNLKMEFGKIIWPDRESLVKQTIAVLLVSIVLGLIIFGLDKLIVFVLFNIIGL